MKTVECPYCREINHSSAPEIMSGCAYCGGSFAEICTENQTLVVLDRNKASAWELAEDLMAEWLEHGELEKEAIVDRRLGNEKVEDSDRRKYPSGLPRTLHMV